MKRVGHSVTLPKDIAKNVKQSCKTALEEFCNRKENGMNLSTRVWNLVKPLKEQMELALELGLSQGKGAAALSRDVRQYLQYPDKLFRRVRDKDGILRLSKAAASFHPGQGVYRSSYKNALRMTVTENNMAYRAADYTQWNEMPFVIGMEIGISNNHPIEDICDELKGVYPKEFKFVGWHPFCRCFAMPKLADRKELNKWARMTDEERKGYTFNGTVKSVPKQFTTWIENNKGRIEKAKSLPYFIRNNFKNGKIADGLKEKYSAATPQQEQQTKPQASTAAELQRLTQFEAKTPQEAIDFITDNIADGCTLPIKKKDLPMVNQIINQVAERMKQFGISKFKNVGVCASKKAIASWTEDNELNFNLSRMNPERVTKAVQSWEKKGIKYTHYEGKDDVVRATIDHELGHKLYWLYGMRSSTTKAFGKAAVTRNGFNEMNEVLGYYASTDEQEYFAEAVARWMGKGRNGVVGYTKELMEELMAKVEAKVGANPIASTEGIHVPNNKTTTLSPEEKARRKDIKKIAKTKLRNIDMYNPNFSKPITISGGKINEWLNQPFADYTQKNEALLKLPELLSNAEYLGYGTDEHDEFAKMHLFETKINTTQSWIIVRELYSGEIGTHSISDNPAILSYLTQKRKK